MFQKFIAWLESIFLTDPTDPLKGSDTSVILPEISLSRIPQPSEQGENVKKVQQRLNDLGASPKLTVDGDYGPKTTAAVSAFQKKNGLAGSGTLGPVTIEKLGLKLSKSTDPIVTTPTGTGAVTPITSDLKGKKSRKLTLELRLAIEAKVFPNRVIPKAFKDKNIPEMVILTAKALEGMKIREVGGNNKGKWVGALQSVIGAVTTSGDGQAWCMSAMQCIVAFIEDYLQVESPVVDSEHCMTCLNSAKKITGLTNSMAEKGTLVIWQRGSTQSGHTGAVIEVLDKSIKTVEGNTGDGDMRDGDGLYPRTRSKVNDGSLYVRGYIRLYPFNKV